MRLRLIFTLLAALIVVGDVCAQSAIYACGHIRRSRLTAIRNLKNSGYSTAILFNVNVEEDGSLTTDFSWDSQQAAEAGGIICQNGAYVFGNYQPNYVRDIKNLITAPTSISRLEICIGGWGNGSYGKIKSLIEKYGTGKETMLYKNFKALKDAIPEIVAVNNDQEQDYDVATARDFHLMLAEIGYKTTVAPYTQKSFWQKLVSEINEAKPGTVEIIYLQTYGGGAYNNPNDWKVFGNIPMHVGFDCEASGDLNGMVSKFEQWRDACGVVGGFLWNYNSEARNLNEWASAINRVFKTKTTNEPVATFYQDSDFGGYAASLPVGSFTQGEMALYGIKAKDISSLKLNDGYKVTLYSLATCSGSSKMTWEETTSFVGTTWNDRACSLVIEKIEDSGVDQVTTADLNVTVVGEMLEVTGCTSDAVSVYEVSGVKVAEAKVDCCGTARVDISNLACGIYVVNCGCKSVKIKI